MTILNIDFTDNNLFWTIIGAIFGSVVSILGERYSNRKKIFISFGSQFRPCGDDKRSFVYAIISNRGNTSLPLLEVKLKQETYPYLQFYFKLNSNLTEIKPQQYLDFEIQVTDEKACLSEKWKSFFDSDYYNSVFRLKINNSTIRLVNSKTLAVRVLAEILYYSNNNFEPKDGWNFLSSQGKKEYISKIGNKFSPKPTRFIKFISWDSFRNYS